MPPKHSILVVDDEPDVVKSVQDLLRLDYKVYGATRAAEAMEIMREHEIHVVMTDQRMPGMGGVEFLNRIRDEHPEAIRLLFTGYADMRAVIEAINQGSVYRYITKPWDPDELMTVIRGACERHDLLAQRRQLLEELQRNNLELEKANAALLQANELKEAFIQVASHELRTPLTILLGLTRLAATAPNIPSPLDDWLRRIDQAGQRLAHLIEQIVAMLSARQFDLPLQRGSTDARTLCRQVAEDVQPFVSLRSQTLMLDLDEDLGSLEIEQAKIRDCLNHLLLNAIKFTPDGGRITLSAQRDGGGVVIRVSDTGVGIESEDLPRIFQPFFTRTNVSRHSSGRFEYLKRGIGLGLSVVKAFVEMHGGTISVRSEPGKGSTFTITLPGGTAQATA